MSTKLLTALSPAADPPRAPAWSLPASSQSSTTASMLLIDFITLAAIFALAVLGRHAITPTYHIVSYWQFFPCIGALLVGFSFQGLYPGVLLHPADEMRKIFLSVTIVFLLMAFSTFLWRNAEAYSRSVFLMTWAAGSPLVLFVRQHARRLLSRYNWWGVSAVVLGSGPSAQRVAKALSDGSHGVKVVAILADENVHQIAEIAGFPIIGPISSAPHLAATNAASLAIVTVPSGSTAEIRHIIQDHCGGFAHIVLVPDIPGLCSLGVSVREIGGELGLEVPQRLFQRSSAMAKRFIDLILTSLAIILLFPVFLCLALAVKLSSSGSIFYNQQRCGRNGDVFNAFKFRTMVPNSERALADYLAVHPEKLIEWNRDRKLRNDPRITAAGKWMRRLSLDELPQLFNVFIGDMSLIGPRPIVQEEIQRYGRCYSLYSRVRPGMTGLWQVSGRNRVTYQERVALDQFYVNNWSIWLDLYILSRTLRAVLTGDGAY